VNCETNLVTKNDQFKQLLTEHASHLLSEKPESVESALKQQMKDKEETVEEYINTFIAKIGEKISLRRFEILTKTDNDAFGSYLHMGGRIGAIVLLDGTKAEEVEKEVAWHDAAVRPRLISSKDVAVE